MALVDFVGKIHKKTKRNYLERMTQDDKAYCAQVAKKFGKDYWDGKRRYGYGGYYYDGRWEELAKKMADYYNLEEGDSVLDVGCGKGFLLYDWKRLYPQAKIKGIDISSYAVKEAKKEVKPFIEIGSACSLPYSDNYFDLVVSINTLHNLSIYELKKALGEIERVSKKNSYVVVESYRNEKEKTNLLCWQLTCECFFSPKEWEWIFSEFGYTGDYSFIFFE